MSQELSNPPRDCARCPRLFEFREANRHKLPNYFNAPVPSFGPQAARLLIVGLAPGLHGANQTGRPFTGDYAGDLLYATLSKFGLARGGYDKHAGDGLQLIDCRIANAVRCVPPQNKPLPAEIASCQPFLAAEIAAMPRLESVLALGRVAHEAVLKVFELRRADHAFAHGRKHVLPGNRQLYDSYHCSRYNTNTGRLTTQMFEAVVQSIVDRN